MSRRAVVLEQAALKFHVFVFGNHLKYAVKFGHIQVEKIQVLLLNLIYQSALNRLDMKLTGKLGVKTSDICNPVTFGSKKDIMLPALFIRAIHSQTARSGPGVMLAYLALHQQVIPPPDLPEYGFFSNELPLRIPQRNQLFEMGQQGVD